MTTMTNDESPRRGNPVRWLVWGAAACVLLLPAVAMRMNVEGVDWDATDFVVMGAILAVACGSYELVARLSGDWLYRAAGGVAILGGLGLVWVNLAVGLIAEGPNPYNLGFMGVLAVGVAGALLSRFQARGLSRTLVAMALVHAVVVVAALVSGPDRLGATFSAVWLAPWLLAAAMFELSARGQKV